VPIKVRRELPPMGNRAATASVPLCGRDDKGAPLARQRSPYDRYVLPDDQECRYMIGVALADWLLGQHRSDRRGDPLSREAEEFEQFAGGRGLAEAVNSDDSPRAPDVLVPEARGPRLDGDAR